LIFIKIIIKIIFKMFSIEIQLNYLKFIIIYQSIQFYYRLIEKLIKWHLESAEIEFDKLATPLSPIELRLL
jgi:uncharacterized membrane protein